MIPMWRVAKTAGRMLFAASVAFATVIGIANAADKVIFVTDYGLYGRHSYYFVAIEKGYYARENLEIEIVRSQGSANTIKQVANATAQVGFADAFAVVLGRANDDIPVKLVAMIYPKPSPRGLCAQGVRDREARRLGGQDACRYRIQLGTEAFYDLCQGGRS